MMFSRFFDQRKQIDALRQDVDELKRQFRAIDLEWSDYADRFRRLMMKLAKRDERAAGSPEGEDTQPVEQESEARFQHLTPRQRLIQQQILARRQRPNGGAE
jgi:hypothetical protein